MIGYFLNPRQIEWVKSNIRRFSEKVDFDVGAILVSDNQGGMMKQVVMYIIEGDGIHYVLDVVTYSMTPALGRPSAKWGDEGAGALSRASELDQAQLRYTVKKRIELLNPTVLQDGDRNFEELKSLISRC